MSRREARSRRERRTAACRTTAEPRSSVARRVAIRDRRAARRGRGGERRDSFECLVVRLLEQAPATEVLDHAHGGAREHLGHVARAQVRQLVEEEVVALGTVDAVQEHHVLHDSHLRRAKPRHRRPHARYPSSSARSRSPDSRPIVDHVRRHRDRGSTEGTSFEPRHFAHPLGENETL